jgi:DNA-binding CsgD family transcriptional regulator
MMLNQGVLGFVHLACDEPALAHARLGPLVAWMDVVGIREPGVIRFVPDALEALIALGEFDRAEVLLRSFQADAVRLNRRWAILAAARLDATRRAALGDAAAAIGDLETAIARHADHVPPMDAARAFLALGTIQRRTLQRKAARSSLTTALERFDALGAAQWSEKARTLLGRSAVDADGDRSAALTPSEQRVVDLVAAGATNRAAADRLFVSVRAIEVHLTNVYRKLGVRSRTELAALVAGQRTAPDPIPEEQTA